MKEKIEPKGKTTYTYTAIQQLDTMTEPNGRVTTYTYDKAGNRKSQLVTLGDSKTTIDYTYNNLNRLTDTVENRDGTIIKTTYTYDENGNQTEVREQNSSTGKTAIDKYKYDELNQLIHIEGRDGSKSEYTYYASGLRASKNVNNNASVFIYDGKELLLERTAEGTKSNIYGNNMIATTGTDTLYYQYNNHGDVVRVLDSSGALKNEYDYDAFGNAITETETVKNPYRYAGYYQDTESGLYYLRSRYYNPQTARFLTEDTASGKYTDPLSLNKYTYCHNQPVTGYDPDGHALQIVLGAAIGGVIGAASSLYQQRKVIGTGAYSYKKYWGSVAEGAITGAVAAATGGASFAATAGGTVLKTAAKTGAKQVAKTSFKTALKSKVMDFFGGIAGNTANQLISSGGGQYSATQALVSGVTEMIDIPGGNMGEKTAKKVGSEVFDKVTDAVSNKAGHEIAENAGAKTLAKTLDGSGSAGVNGSGLDPYVLMKEKGIPQTLSDAEIDAAKQMDLQMNAYKGGSKPDFYSGPDGVANSLFEYDEFTGYAKNSCGNPVDIVGNGHTGRTMPNNLNEQMAMRQVRSNPLEGATELPFTMKDTRWSAKDGWVKMENNVYYSNGSHTSIHFVYNKITGAFDDFKFKDK